MGVKLTWSKVGTTHLTRRLLAGVARNTPGSTPRRLAAAFQALGESLGAQELHLPHYDGTKSLFSGLCANAGAAAPPARAALSCRWALSGFDVAHARCSQSRGSCGIANLV